MIIDGEVEGDAWPVGNLGMMPPVSHLYWSASMWRNAVSPRPFLWSGMKRSLISSPKYNDY
jgi:hypothetical protein